MNIKSDDHEGRKAKLLKKIKNGDFVNKSLSDTSSRKDVHSLITIHEMMVVYDWTWLDNIRPFIYFIND